MKNKMVIVFSMLLLFVVACKKDKEADKCCDPTNPKCSNFDPCLGQNEVSADFVIEQEVMGAGPLVDSFIIGLNQFNKSRIRFRALENNANYEWIIGHETLSTQSVIRDFGNVPRGMNIPIQLKVTKTPNKDCFPFDDGKDQKSKTFRIIKSYNDLNIAGSYKGVFNDSSDSTEIFIGFKDGYLFAIRKKDSLKFINMYAGRYAATDLFLYLREAGYSSPKGYAKLNPKNWELEMRYEHTKNKLKLNSDSISFKGRKLK